MNTRFLDHLLCWVTHAPSEVVDVICNMENMVPETDYHAWITYHDATTYAALTAHTAKSGPLLCVIVLIVWTLTICKITRIALDFMEAVYEAGDNASKGLSIHLHLSRFTISKFTYTRVAWAYVLGLFQIGIALLLLIVGGRWLVVTTRSGDLVLNAVALNYIMEIDEFIFVTIVPKEIVVIIRNLEPLPFRTTPRFSCDRLPFQIPAKSMIAFFLMTLFVIGESWFSLSDHIEQVDRTMAAICGEQGEAS